VEFLCRSAFKTRQRWHSWSSVRPLNEYVVRMSLQFFSNTATPCTRRRSSSIENGRECDFVSSLALDEPAAAADDADDAPLPR